MTATEILRREHDLILKVLDVAEAEVAGLETNPAVNGDTFEKLLDFFRNFADRCHHGKEEAQLFTRLQLRGMPVEGGPIGVMLHEHTVGRQFLRGVADSLPAARTGNELAVESLAENLAGYIQLLRAHIAKENNILFPMAERLLPDADKAELLIGFTAVEAVEMGADTHERYQQLAQELTVAV